MRNNRPILAYFCKNFAYFCRESFTGYYEKDTERTHCYLQIESDTGTLLQLSRIYVSVALPQRVRADVCRTGVRQVSGGRQYHRLSGGRLDFLRVGTSSLHAELSRVGRERGVPRIRGEYPAGKDFMQYSFSHYTQFASIRSLLEKVHRGIRFPLAGKSEITDCLKRIPVSHGVEQIIQILTLLQALSAFPRKQFAASPNYIPDPSVFGDKKIEKIIAYLNKRYTQPVSLSEIASYTAMNEAAFCRYFKQETGKTFKQYILDMRIGYACKLIAAERMNISQISLECGFESTAHFNRIFKRTTGMSPTEYKESIL